MTHPFPSRRSSDRIVFLAGALIIAVCANGVRAFGTIYVANRTSVDFAVGFEHVIYGWVFFASVIALVMAAGWPLFDRRADEAFFDPAKLKGAVRHGGQAAVIAPLLIVIAAVATLWTGAMTATSDPLPKHSYFPDVPGRTRGLSRPHSSKEYARWQSRDRV